MTNVFDKPRIVTEADLVATLMPYMLGYPWALDTIGDLWRMGAPDMTPRLPGQPEKRILNPGQFAKWWADVSKRSGADLTANQVTRRA